MDTLINSRNLNSTRSGRLRVVELSALAVLTLTLTLNLTQPHPVKAQTETAAQSEQWRTPQMDIQYTLAADLIPFISRPDAQVLLGRVTGTDLRQQDQHDMQWEVGVVILEVQQVLQGNAFPAGAAIRVPVARAADPAVREINNQNQWNNLTLNQGELLLLCGTPGTEKGELHASAGTAVASDQDPMVLSVQECCRIEKTGERQKKQALLQDALLNSAGISMYFALDALGRRAVFGREAGAQMTCLAVDSGKLEPQSSDEVCSYLTNLCFFNGQEGADLTNQRIASTLAGEMSRAKEPERKLELAQLLASCVLDEFSDTPGEDEEIRKKLVASVGEPASDVVISGLLSISELGDELQQNRTGKLLEVWRSAHQVAR